MPISDEVIELAPVNKTKKTLIVLFVVLGVFVALAVTFLVMYLLKPNVEENPVIVNAVTVQNSDMFTVTEDGVPVKYASVGSEYKVYANISVEKGDPNITWEVMPAGAIHINEQNDVPTVDEATGEYKGAYIAFTPNNGYNNTDVTIKARSLADMSKSAEVTFKVVLQGAASIRVNQYYPQGESVNALPVENDSLSIPYYTGNDSNNKRYVLTFDQLGRYNESTGEYAPISVVGTGETASNMIEVVSSNPAAVAVSNPSPGAFYFRAVSASRGNAVITIKANVNNEPAGLVEKQITVNVVSNTTLGYIEDVYFFNQAVVNGEFIEGVVANCFTAGKLDNTKLDAFVGTFDGLAKNPREFTLPYDGSGTYDGIYSHILVNPISIQYADGEFKEDWFKKIEVASSDTGILQVSTANNGAVSLRARGLASSADGAATCNLTFTDKTVGSIRARNSVAVRVVAQNEGGIVSAKIGNTVVTEGNPINVAPNVEATMTVTYKIKMPGNTELTSLLDKDYLTKRFMLDFNADMLEVTIVGGTEPIVPRTPQTLTAGSITFTRTGGSETVSQADFDGTVVFNVKIKSAAQTDEYPITFTKIGTTRTGLPDWENVDKGDRTWSKAMTFNVTRRATDAFFIDGDEANGIVTDHGSRLGRFELDPTDPTVAHIYVQNQREGTAFGSLFNVRSLVDTDATEFSTKVQVPRYDGDVFTLTRATATNPNDTLTFKGYFSPSSLQSTEAKISVYDVTGAEVIEDGLTVYIHVFDAVVGFGTVEEKQNTYSSDRTGLSNGFITIAKSEITVQRSLNQNFTSYNVENEKIDLLYVDATTGDYAQLERTTSGSNIYFSHNGHRLLMFATTTGRLTPVVDLFAYSYYAGVDVSNLLFEVSLSDNEYFLGTVAPKGTVSCKFVRKADRVAVFRDTGWRDADRLALDEQTARIDYRVNQGDIAKLYLSADVKVKDPRTETAADEWVVARRLASVNAESPYVVLPSGLSASSGTIVSGTDGYSWVEFTAPRVTGSGNEANYLLNITAGETRPIINLTVQNYARTISEIGFYGDADGNNALDLDAHNRFMFGGFVNGDLYTRIVYVKIGYVAASESYMYYESATFTLPYYLSVVVSDEIVKIDNPNPNAPTRVYRITPSKDDVKTFSGYKIFECEIQLDVDSTAHTGDSITIAQMYGGQTPVSDSVEVCVASGLKGVEMTSNDVTSSDITIDFDLADANDAQSRTFTVSYNTVTESARANIKYDNSDVDTLAISAPASVTGLILNGDGLRASLPTFTVGVDLNALKAPATLTFALSFTDTVNGATVNNVFTVNFTVNVNVDVYSIGFGGNTEYTVEINGGGGNVIPQEIELTFNDGNPDIQPIDAKKATVVPSLVVKNGNAYDTYVGGMQIKNESGKYMLYVPNNVQIGTNFYVRAYYSESVVAYKHISIVTTSHRIRFAQTGNIEISADGKAEIVVSQVGQKFKLAVEVINDGTQMPVDGKNANLSYGVYTDETYTEQANYITIDNAGNIIVVDPETASGIVYYRASYRDVGGTGNYYYVYAEIKYILQVTSVELKSNDFISDSNGTVMLYWSDALHYTSIDLQNRIDIANALGVEYATGDVAVTMASSNAAVGVSGLKLIPTAQTDDVGVTLTLTAKYGNTESFVKEFKVVVKKPAGLVLNDGTTSGEIDVIAGTDITVTPVYNSSYNGLNARYTLSSVSGLTVSGDGDVKTVSLTDRQAAVIGTSYTLTAKVEYSLKQVDRDMEIVGGLWSTVKFTVTIAGEYAPEFDLVCGSDTVVPVYDLSDAGTKHTVSTSENYRLAVTNGGAHGYNSPSYSATPDREIVGISSFTGTAATVTPVTNASGQFRVTVSATVYGKTFTAYKDYYFTYGADASASLYMQAPGETDYAEFTADTQAIDFSGSDPYKFKYEISGLDTSVVAASDIDIVVNGAVSVGAVTRGTNSYYVEIVANKPTTLSVGGSVRVVNRTVYFAQQTVTLTATPPEFTLSATSETVLAGSSITLAVNKTAGQGTYTVKYEIESGSGAAVNASTGLLNADRNITLDRTVTVKATVTMTNGAFNTETYVLRKTISVIGVPLPTVGWNKQEVYVDVGRNYNLSDWYTQNVNVSHTGGSYTYGLTVNVADSAVGLAKTTDYTLTNGKLTVKDTSKTKAGGKITLTLSAKINGTGINGGAAATVTVAEITVIVNPQAQAVSNVVVSNGTGSYDISGVAKPYVTAESGYFVAAADKYELVGLELVNASDKNDFAVNGSVLTVKNNILTEKIVSLRATIEITSGNYANKRMVCETSVTVAVPQLSSAGVVYWNASTYGYDALSDVASRLTIVELNAENNPVTAISVAAVDNGAFVSVANNNTSTPVITVDKDFNTAIGTATANKEINLEYRITLKNGHVYYVAETLQVQSVAIEVKSYENAVDTQNELNPATAISKESGESFAIVFTANNGFTPSVTDVLITENNGATNSLNAKFGGDRIVFAVADISENKEFAVAVTLKIGGSSTVINYTVNGAAALTSALYTVSRLDNTEFALNAVGSVNSVWTKNGTHNYTYGGSVTLSSQYDLGTYLSSVSLKNSTGTQTYDAITNISGRSITLDFDPDYDWNVNLYNSGFMLNLVFKTNAPINRTVITAKFQVYTRALGNQSQTVTVQYALRVVNDITVTLDTNAGADAVTGVSESVTRSYKSTYSLSDPIRAGYVFNGWFTQAVGGMQIATTDIVSDTNDHTLYAHWTAEQYTVSFNANGGSVSQASKQVRYRDMYGKLPTPTRAGYTFTGWYTASDSGTQVDAGDIMETVGNSALYAHWTANKITVTFDTNGGDLLDGYVLTKGVTVGSTYGDLPTPVRGGYTFRGWFTSLTNEVKVESTSSVTETEDHTLYARWTATTYLVRFNVNDRPNTTVSMSGQITVTYGQPYGELPTATTAGYTFIGWYTAETDGYRITPDTIVTRSEDHYLYAHWTINSYTVTLDAEGGSIAGLSSLSTVLTYQSVYKTHLSVIPTREGYEFAGWFTQAEGGTKKITNITVDSDITLYAHWTPIEYTVTFDTNGGAELAEADGSKQVAFGAQYGDLPTPAEREGFTFVGWFTQAEGGEQKDSATVMNTAADHTLYAHWEADTEPTE